MKLANKRVQEVVDRMDEFTASNIFAEWERVEGRSLYIVYSWGKHYPMYINIRGDWYGNSDYYSISTQRHKTQARPTGHVRYLSTESLKRIIRRGVYENAEPK
jgi:hypothetical protein